MLHMVSLLEPECHSNLFLKNMHIIPTRRLSSALMSQRHFRQKDRALLTFVFDFANSGPRTFLTIVSY